MAVYLTPNQLLRYYDKRRIYEVASDTGAPIPDLSTCDSILWAIRSASGELDSALQVGKRYQRQVVEDLIDAANSVAADDPEKERILTRAALVQELVAHLAFVRLMSRRGFAADKMKQLAPMAEEAQKKIGQLASGIAVLDLTDNIQAGVPKMTLIGSRNASLSRQIRMFGHGAYRDQWLGGGIGEDYSGL